MTSLGAEDSGKPFAGGSIDGWDVPPLNALAHKQPAWTADQLTAYLRTGLANEHGAAAGPMEPVTRQLGLVSESDVRAMAVYLLSLNGQPAAAAPAPQAAAGSQPADQGDAQRLVRGGALFTSTCASCHAASAPMMSIGDRPSLAASSVANAASPRNAINLVLQGIPLRGSNASHYMPSFAHTLNDQQVADVLAFMRVSIAQRPAWADLDDSVAKIRKENTSK
jgi:mono/diheme cytochrome c family protein